jgi:fatty acid omega-hydroxylase
VIRNCNNNPDAPVLVVSLPFMKPYILVNNDPKIVEYAMSTNFDNYIKGPLFNDRLHEILGQGIFNQDGKHWYMQRKIGSKIFTAKKFKDLFDSVFQENITVFTDHLKKKSGSVVDMHDLFHRFFLDSFSKIAFGVILF